MSIREPTANWHGVLWVEDVGSRRVVDDYGVLEVATNLGQIFHIVALVVVAALTEKAVMDDLVDVQLVEKRIAILGRLSAAFIFTVIGHFNVPWTQRR